MYTVVLWCIYIIIHCTLLICHTLVFPCRYDEYYVYDWKISVFLRFLIRPANQTSTNADLLRMESGHTSSVQLRPYTVIVLWTNEPSTTWPCTNSNIFCDNRTWKQRYENIPRQVFMYTWAEQKLENNRTGQGRTI